MGFNLTYVTPINSIGDSLEGSNGQYLHLKVQTYFDAQAYAGHPNKYNFTFLEVSQVFSPLFSPLLSHVGFDLPTPPLPNVHTKLHQSKHMKP